MNSSVAKGDANRISFEGLNSFKDSEFITNGSIAITIDRRCDKFSLSPHSHDYYELEYISSGEGVQIINNEAYVVKKGDIVFFKLNDIHTYYSVNGMQVINCCFKLEDVPDMKLINYNNGTSVVLSTSNEAQLEFENLLNMIRCELEKQREFLNEALSYYLNLIMIFLKRQGYMRQKEDVRWSSFFIYLSKNYKTITLQDASDEMCVTKNHFCKLFRDRFGKTFHSYINEIKLKSAQKLLLTTQMTIDSVWQEAGFTQAKQFYQLIKKDTGMTPVQYRIQKHGGNIPRG